jgi:hypothetical protein
MFQAKVDEQLHRYLLSEKVLRVLDELLEYEKRHGENPLRIVTSRTAAEIVAEGRQ